MKVTLFGAAKEVTGSCYMLQTDRSTVLVDCGMFQGPRRLERLNFIPRGLPVDKVEAVLLTHGHLDHCGRLPMLYKAGYRGPIYATQGTIEIAMLILRDAAHIQENDVKRENRRRQRARQSPIRPLFNSDDVIRVCKQFQPVELNEMICVADGINARFVDAGHILGSASIEVFAEEGRATKDDFRKLVFSGDIGPYNVPIMHDPASIEKADVVFLESTYGDRDHRDSSSTLEELKATLLRASETCGKILIPTFAVGRAQQVLYYLASIYKSGQVPILPVMLDSPMAIAATEIYARHSELMDEAGLDIFRAGKLRKDVLPVRTCTTVEESQMLNDVKGPCVILAGAGMCNAGRILQHFKHNLWRDETIVIMVGYQAKGSLGRMLIDGADKVKIYGETIAVRASIKSIGGLSAHAGQTDLLRWVEPMATRHAHIVLTHGEPHQIQQLGNEILNRYGIKCEAPRIGETIEVPSRRLAARSYFGAHSEV